MHAAGLLETAGQDSDLDAGLERQIERGRQCAEERLAATPVGPDERITRLIMLEEAVTEIRERRAVALDDRLARDCQ